MRVIPPHIREVLPAAGAFVMARFGHDGGEVASAGDLKITQDEEFVEGGGIAEDGMSKTFGGEGQGDGGFEVGADLFGLTGGFDGLLDDGAGFQQLFDGGGGLGGGESGIWLREGFEMDAVRMSKVLI